MPSDLHEYPRLSSIRRVSLLNQYVDQVSKVVHTEPKPIKELDHLIEASGKISILK